MSLLTEIHERLERIESALVADHSPWLRGDHAAAKWAGYKTRNGFRKWTKTVGIEPIIEGGLNFWRKDDIIKAREK